MGLNQGKNRLKRGIVRYLTPHEIKSGYVFISLDKHLSDILDVTDFEVHIFGRVFESRRIDVSGRVSISAILLKDIGPRRSLRIKRITRKRIDMDVLSVVENDNRRT